MIKKLKLNLKSPMTKTLLVCVGTLPLFYGIAGCCAQEPSKTSQYTPPTPAYTDTSKKMQPVGTVNPSLVGPRGPQGPAGPTGAKGAVGATGAEGVVAVGPAGEAGPAGAEGARGEKGDTGAQGATLYGPKGATGRAGSSGEQGASGATGAQGSVSVVDRWTFYRDFIFDDNRSDFHPSDFEKSAEIARYIKENPSLKIGIDGFMDPRTTEIDERRIATVRNSLISAGIPEYKIEKGSFGNPQYARKQRVAVLIRTAN
jgi:outer membrane protein OmpA-like peptidoglycan-associated protein